MDQRNIVLIGFMGTGKTTVGRRLAAQLGREFYDTDNEIERLVGMTVSEIFVRHGETRFRSEETLMAKKMGKVRNAVIATGGGIVLKPENIAALRENGLIICLQARPEVILERVSRKGTRPLLKRENPLQVIVEMLEERREAYQVADFYVDTSDLTYDEILEVIMAYLGKGE